MTPKNVLRLRLLGAILFACTTFLFVLDASSNGRHLAWVLPRALLFSGIAVLISGVRQVQQALLVGLLGAGLVVGAANRTDDPSLAIAAISAAAVGAIAALRAGLALGWTTSWTPPPRPARTARARSGEAKPPSAAR